MGVMNGFAEAKKTQEIVQKLMPRGAGSCVTSLFNFFTQPLADAAGYMATHGGEGQEARTVKGLMGEAFKADGNGLTDFWIGEKGKEGSMHLNGAKIAGAAGSLGIGYRALSGGGVYRDKDGNTDIAGIPFV